MNTEKEKIKKYLLLFGLKENFAVDDLTHSYRTLAKLKHPDINQKADSEVMKEINEGFHFLKDCLNNGLIDKYAPEDQNHSEKQRITDIFYDQYKKGFSILKSAFENYYGEREDKSLAGDMNALTTELRRAKIEFSVLINDLPYNQWINDAIDKVNSINKWLEP